MRSIRDGMPAVTRSQRPPRWARYSAKAQASPFAWRGGSVHQLEVQMRSGRVSRMADATNLLAGAEDLSSRHGDAARREMREEGKDPSALDDHVVPGEANGVEPAAPEGQHVLHRTPRFVYDIHPLTLRCVIHGGRDLAIEGRMDPIVPIRSSRECAHRSGTSARFPPGAGEVPRDGRSGRSRRRSASPARPSRGSGSGTTASSRLTTRVARQTRRRPDGRAHSSWPDRSHDASRSRSYRLSVPKPWPLVAAPNAASSVDAHRSPAVARTSRSQAPSCVRRKRWSQVDRRSTPSSIFHLRLLSRQHQTG
jgi:hypothetical protein